MSEQFKRHVAYKLRIGDILIGTPVIDGERFSFLELGDKKVVRVNLIGNIIDKYESVGNTDGEGKKYLFLSLDDGSGQIRLKLFGEDCEKFKHIVQGQTVVVIGNLKYWNNEIYITPEIIREVDVKYLLLRKLEIERGHSSNLETNKVKEKILSIRDRILDLIKGAEERGGIEYTEIFSEFPQVSTQIIQQEIQKLLEDGIIFEPRPGKVMWLG
ncbi:MAG: OB-fold nucleic acid binding domain-containing protein [Candidatus Pacearchaeota archaeon]